MILHHGTSTLLNGREKTEGRGNECHTMTRYSLFGIPYYESVFCGHGASLGLLLGRRYVEVTQEWPESK